MRRRFDEIVEFSGVGKFIDTPVKRYSFGMYVRLAFAVAAHLEPEILLVDEVLALLGIAHAAGVSPTMADWEMVVNVDLVGTALLVDALTPLVVPGTSMVCFASMAAAMGTQGPDPTVDPVLDDPLGDDLLVRLRDAVGELIENSGMAYGVAKRGVVRLVQRTAAAWGPHGGRISSVSPGLIDTPSVVSYSVLPSAVATRVPAGIVSSPGAACARVSSISPAGRPPRTRSIPSSATTLSSASPVAVSTNPDW